MPASARAKEPLIERLPLEERIRQRATLDVARWLDDNQFGSQLDNWLQAEEEIVHAHQDALIDEASEESFTGQRCTSLLGAFEVI